MIGRKCSFYDLVGWVDATSGVTATSPLATNVVIRYIERFMITASASSVESTIEAALLFTPAKLQALVKKYSVCVATYSAEKSSNAHFVVEQRSLELLVKWITFCLAHKHCCSTRSLLRSFKIALR